MPESHPWRAKCSLLRCQERYLDRMIDLLCHQDPLYPLCQSSDPSRHRRSEIYRRIQIQLRELWVIEEAWIGGVNILNPYYANELIIYHYFMFSVAMKSGTLMVIGEGEDWTDRKVFEIKVVNTFPIITITSHKTKLIANWDSIDIDDYQHFSIPPDLSLHLTKSKGNNPHLWFDTNIVHTNGTLNHNPEIIRLFTWCSCPISQYSKPTGKYFQAELICLWKDIGFTKNTGIFIDFLVHELPNHMSLAPGLSYLYEGMRPIDNNIVWPYQFNQIVRWKHKIKANYYFTIRLWYYEANTDYAILDVPFQIK